MWINAGAALCACAPPFKVSREMNVTLAHSSNISPDVDDLQGLS